MKNTNLGNILVAIIVLFMGGGLVFSIDQNANLKAEKKDLIDEAKNDSTLIYEKDSVIRDYANMNLTLRNAAGKVRSIDNELTNNKAYVDISAKYN